MNEFEREYYESEDFWKGEMLHDETNMSRFKATALLIPHDARNVVDVGCGNGVFVNFLLKNNPSLDVYAVDRSIKALEFVKAKKKNADITNLPFEDNFFDCVACLEVLEHLTIKDFQTALSELVRISNKYIIISVPYNEEIEESYTKCPGCKSIFNYELHLRKFDDSAFKNLFNHLGYKNVSVQKLGEMTQYKGHFRFRKLFYPEQILKWRSPVCPLCGYKAIKNLNANSASFAGQYKITPKRKLISYLSWLPKSIWPKEKKHYWIMGLFQKV